MKVLNISCPNCKASLEMDIDKLMVYCPYCRTKLPIDVDVDKYMSEKEQTKREKMHIDKELEIDSRERKSVDYERKKDTVVAIIGALVILLIWLHYAF